MAATATPLTKMTATAAAAINGWMRLRGDSDRFGLALTAISMVDACVYNALAGLHVYRQLVRCVSNCVGIPAHRDRSFRSIVTDFRPRPESAVTIPESSVTIPE